MRKTCIVIIAVITVCSVNGQSISRLKETKERLTVERNVLDDSITFLTQFISVLQRVEDFSIERFSAVVYSAASAKRSSLGGDNFLGDLDAGDSVVVYDFLDGQYLVRNNFVIGLIPKVSIEQTKAVQKYNKRVLKGAKKRDKSYHGYNSNSNTSKSSGTYKSSGSSSYGGSRSIKTGPRGGKYYINKNGKKTYVKKKK